MRPGISRTVEGERHQGVQLDLVEEPIIDLGARRIASGIAPAVRQLAGQIDLEVTLLGCTGIVGDEGHTRGSGPRADERIESENSDKEEFSQAE